MQSLLENRIVRGFAALAVAVLLFMARRWLLPLDLDSPTIPFTIAVPSVLYSCYNSFDAVACLDPALVVLGTLAVALATGWGSLGLMLLALIMVPLPLITYFLMGPIWLVLAALAAIPLVAEFALYYVFPGPVEEG